MNILFLADMFPYPPQSGGRLRTYNLLKQISSNNNIDFICKSEEVITNDKINHLKRYAKSVNCIVDKKKSSVNRIINLLKNKSDKVYLSFSNEYQQKVDTYLENNEYDIIFVDSFYVYQYIYNNVKVNRSKSKIIIDLHNVEHEIIYRMMKKSTSLFIKIYGFKEYRNIIKLEKKYVKDVDLILNVSQRDKDQYIKLYNIDPKKMVVINNGVDINIANNYKLKNQLKEEQYVLFIGSLWYRPNRDGITWFIKKIWPIINKELPELKLKIIGKNLDNQEEEKYENVEYLGFIDDIYEYYSKCSCFIVPIQYGSGTRLKILEAMSFKCPIVSTTIGAEGLEVENMKNIILSDAEDLFAKNVINVIEDKKLSDKLSINGYKLVEEEYTWDKIGEKLRTSIEALIRSENE